jgi:hydrogenase/urease accessory protein HupE
MAMLARMSLIAALFIASFAAHADVFRPAYLELRETGGDRYDVTWKVPALGSDRRLAAYVEFPASTRYVTDPRVVVVDSAWVESYRIERPGGLVGETVSISGNAVGVTDVIARVERLDGSSQVERLSLERPQFEVLPPAGKVEIAWAYFVMGVEHILAGIDHLLFVLALLLIVDGTRRLVMTITAFTVAHSITLVAATLGWLHVPGPPVEAIIALSIVFVASEVIQRLRGRDPLTARAPWIVAFSFGLLHGLGFAGALAEVGLPQVAIPVALLMFNVGVEVGQLLFVAAVVGLQALVARLVAVRGDWITAATAYGIGAVAAFWTIERVVGFWG